LKKLDVGILIPAEVQKAANSRKQLTLVIKQTIRKQLCCEAVNQWDRLTIEICLQINLVLQTPTASVY
jgi:hypothetical protein